MNWFRNSSSRIEKSPRSIVYVQNNGKWNGEQFSSMILSCNVNHTQMEANLFQINHHLYQFNREIPIRWYHIMTNELLNADTPHTGEKLGNFMRQNCFVLDDVFYQGGNIFGGKKGDKFVELPEFTENHLPVRITKESPVITDICTFKDGTHQCTLQKYKASVEGMRGMQNAVISMLLKKERDTWKDSPLNKKDQILQELQKISKTHTAIKAEQQLEK